MSYPYYDDVQRAYNDLKAEGKIGPRSSQEQVEADKGLITQRAAFYTSSRDGTIGVMEKSSGNHYVAADGNGYSVDWVLRSTDGTGWDVVTDNGSEALPSNGGPYPPDPSNIPRWRPATKENAQYTGSVDPGPTPPPDGGGADTQTILDAITASQTAVTTAIAESEARILADGQSTRDLIVKYADQVDQWATLILAVWLKLHAPEEPVRDVVTKVREAWKAIQDSDDRP